ncbi:pilus assembly protein [Vibrio diazotrophicus]|uniref:TadE/TadG family type IV pilus assembly protein n=1 Tax=Vibrio diazotrophicus TaxID=685 RepID=UPI0022AE7384|nr:TadE/TadG family type IV pilus assembly protein [Vibrio diazotrophicus]MCZ4373015.1 pilus assembly protein [Vibrio diazotrophicus]
MRNFVDKQSGIAAVEFLVTLPVLLLIFTVVIEFGNAFIRYSTLNKSVQNAARYAVVNIYGTATSGSIANESDIKKMVMYGKTSFEQDETPTPVLDSLTLNNISVLPVGNYVVISATYDYQSILNLLPIDALDDLTVRSSAVMRVAP